MVGGGLAGIAAALALADAARPVTLIERRPFLGGRAFSFLDPDSGEEIDNGQHVLVGACTRLRAFLDRIDAPKGAFERQTRLGLTLLENDGREARLAAVRLPGPLHLAAAALKYGHLKPRERVSVIRDVRRLAQLDEARLAALEDEPLGTWLARRRVSRAAVRAFWDPLVRPALNIVADDANTPLVAAFVRRALWAPDDAAAMWLPRVGLSRALGEPGHRALTASGVDVRLATRTETIEIRSGAVCGVRLASGESIPANRVVSALPPRQAQRVVPPEARPDHGFEAVGRSAIVNVYLWYDRPVLRTPMAGVLDPELQWVFDRRHLLGPGSDGAHCVGVTLSAADAWLDIGKDTIVSRCDTAMARVFGARRGARLLRSAVVKDPAATFRAGPGVNRLRPPTATAVDGLLLAGDWIATGWPATMEGAVRSGERAAAAALAAGR